MAFPPAGDPLSGFSQLSPCVYHLPAADAESVSSDTESNGAGAGSSHDGQPDLIVLCAWVNAAPRHIAKYIAKYLSLYPSSAQLLITTSLADLVYRPNSVQRSRFAPALRVLLAAVEPASATTPPNTPPNSTPASPPHILLHIFSHGGSHTACQLALAFRIQTNGCPLPVSAIILDSTPGHGTYKRSLGAMILSLPPSPLIRIAGTPLVHAYLAGVSVMGWVFGAENVVQRLRRGLNDRQLFTAEAPRLYVYSKADRMVWWEDIEEHAKAAEDLGWDVEKVRFEESAHVAHIVEDGERYWDAVKRTWGKIGGPFLPSAKL